MILHDCHNKISSIWNQDLALSWLMAKILHGSIARFLNDLAIEISKIVLKFLRTYMYLEPRPCLILAKILHGSIARFLNDHANKISRSYYNFHM